MGGEADIKVLALDQAPRKTGWAIGRPCWPEPPLFGVFSLPSWVDREGEMNSRFCEWLYHMIVSHGVTDVIYEAPVDNDKWAKDFQVTVTQGAQIGSIWTVTRNALGKEPTESTVQDMRKRFIGTNTVPPGLTRPDIRRQWLKDQAIKACAMRGWLVEDHNVAEALGHCDHALSTLSHRHAGKSDVLFRRADLNLTVARFRGELA